MHGRYPARHLAYYRKLCRGKFKIAVDGGYSFFRKTGLVPDLLMGDFDSLKKNPADLPRKTEIIKYPREKDKTDSELALEYCLDKKAKRIDIVQPSVGEPDQFMGNAMLLLPGAAGRVGYRPKIRLINVGYELLFVENERITVEKAAGDTVSVLALSGRCRYSCTGTDFDVKDIVLKPGQSRGLRNKIAAKKAVFDIAGRGFFIRNYKTPRIV